MAKKHNVSKALVSDHHLKYSEATVEDVINYVTSPSFCKVPWDSVTMSVSNGENSDPSMKKSIVHIHRASAGKRSIFDIKLHNCQKTDCQHKVCSKKCSKEDKHTNSPKTGVGIESTMKPVSGNSLASAYSHFIERVKLSPGRKSRKTLSPSISDAQEKTCYDKFNCLLKKLASLQSDKEIDSHLLKYPQSSKVEEKNIKKNKITENKIENGEDKSSCVLHIVNNGTKRAVQFDLHPAIEAFLLKAISTIENKKKTLLEKENKRQKSETLNNELRKKQEMEENNSSFSNKLSECEENFSEDTGMDEEAKYSTDSDNLNKTPTQCNKCEYNKKSSEASCKVSDESSKLRSSLASSNSAKLAMKKSVHFSDESIDSEVDVSDEDSSKGSKNDSTLSKKCEMYTRSENENSNSNNADKENRTANKFKIENNSSSKSVNGSSGSIKCENDQSAASRSSEEGGKLTSRTENEVPSANLNEIETNTTSISECRPSRSSAGSDIEGFRFKRSETWQFTKSDVSAKCEDMTNRMTNSVKGPALKPEFDLKPVKDKDLSKSSRLLKGFSGPDDSNNETCHSLSSNDYHILSKIIRKDKNAFEGSKVSNCDSEKSYQALKSLSNDLEETSDSSSSDKSRELIKNDYVPPYTTKGSNNTCELSPAQCNLASVLSNHNLYGEMSYPRQNRHFYERNSGVLKSQDAENQINKHAVCNNNHFSSKIDSRYRYIRARHDLSSEEANEYQYLNSWTKFEMKNNRRETSGRFSFKTTPSSFNINSTEFESRKANHKVQSLHEGFHFERGDMIKNDSADTDSLVQELNSTAHLDNPARQHSFISGLLHKGTLPIFQKVGSQQKFCNIESEEFASSTFGNLFHPGNNKYTHSNSVKSILKAEESTHGGRRRDDEERNTFHGVHFVEAADNSLHNYPHSFSTFPVTEEIQYKPFNSTVSCSTSFNKDRFDDVLSGRNVLTNNQDQPPDNNGHSTGYQETARIRGGFCTNSVETEDVRKVKVSLLNKVKECVYHKSVDGPALPTNTDLSSVSLRQNKFENSATTDQYSNKKKFSNLSLDVDKKNSFNEFEKSFKDNNNYLNYSNKKELNDEEEEEAGDNKESGLQEKSDDANIKEEIDTDWSSDASLRYPLGISARQVEPSLSRDTDVGPRLSELSLLDVKEYLDSEFSQSDTELSRNWIMEKSEKKRAKRNKVIKKKIKKETSSEDILIKISSFLNNTSVNESSLSRTMAEGENKIRRSSSSAIKHKDPRSECAKPIRETIAFNRNSGQKDNMCLVKEDPKKSLKGARSEILANKHFVIPVLPIKLPNVEVDNKNNYKKVVKKSWETREEGSKESREQVSIVKESSDIFIIKERKQNDFRNIGQKWLERRASELLTNERTNLSSDQHKKNAMKKTLTDQSEQLKTQSPLSYSQKKKYIQEIIKKAEDLRKRGHKILQKEPLFVGYYETIEGVQCQRKDVKTQLNLKRTVSVSTEDSEPEAEGKGRQKSIRNLRWQDTNELCKVSRAKPSGCINDWFQDPTLCPLNGFSPNMAHL